MILAPYSLIFQNPITKWSSYRDYKHYKVYPRPFAPSSPMLLSQPIVSGVFLVMIVYIGQILYSLPLVSQYYYFRLLSIVLLGKLTFLKRILYFWPPLILYYYPSLLLNVAFRGLLLFLKQILCFWLLILLYHCHLILLIEGLVGWLVFL